MDTFIHMRAGDTLHQEHDYIALTEIVLLFGNQIKAGMIIHKINNDILSVICGMDFPADSTERFVSLSNAWSKRYA